MAEIIERKKKDGTFSYMIRVYSGRTRDDKVITKCKTVTPPTGMGKKRPKSGCRSRRYCSSRRSRMASCWTQMCCWMPFPMHHRSTA